MFERIAAACIITIASFVIACSTPDTCLPQAEINMLQWLNYIKANRDFRMPSEPAAKYDCTADVSIRDTRTGQRRVIDHMDPKAWAEQKARVDMESGDLWRECGGGFDFLMSSLLNGDVRSIAAFRRTVECFAKTAAKTYLSTVVHTSTWSQARESWERVEIVNIECVEVPGTRQLLLLPNMRELEEVGRQWSEDHGGQCSPWTPPSMLCQGQGDCYEDDGAPDTVTPGEPAPIPNDPGGGDHL